MLAHGKDYHLKPPKIGIEYTSKKSSTSAANIAAIAVSVCPIVYAPSVHHTSPIIISDNPVASTGADIVAIRVVGIAQDPTAKIINFFAWYISSNI